MSPTDPLDLDRQICFPLYAATRAVTRRYAEVLADVGLTYPQYLVMLALWTDGPLSVGDLGRRLRLDSGTLTPLLKRLEASGRVDAAPRPPRRAAGRREPGTPAAAAPARGVAGVPREVARSIGLEADEFGQLQRLLSGLIENLDAVGPPA